MQTITIPRQSTCGRTRTPSANGSRKATSLAGINYRDIETLDATTAKEIKTCWAFEVNRTFTSAKDLSVTLSIGEYLTEKFGIEVNEHDADIAEDGEVDEEAPPV